MRPGLGVAFLRPPKAKHLAKKLVHLGSIILSRQGPYEGGHVSRSFFKKCKLRHREVVPLGSKGRMGLESEFLGSSSPVTLSVIRQETDGVTF